VRINSFSKIINSSERKFIVRKKNLLRFKYNFWDNIFRKGEGEGLIIRGNSIFVLNENKQFRFRKPFRNLHQPSTLQEYNFSNRKKINGISLPRSFVKGSWGIESLA